MNSLPLAETTSVLLAPTTPGGHSFKRISNVWVTVQKYLHLKLFLLYTSRGRRLYRGPSRPRGKQPSRLALPSSTGRCHRLRAPRSMAAALKSKTCTPQLPLDGGEASSGARPHPPGLLRSQRSRHLSPSSRLPRATPPRIARDNPRPPQPGGTTIRLHPLSKKRLLTSRSASHPGRASRPCPRSSGPRSPAPSW